MARQFADVRYAGVLYLDAELVDGVWHYYDEIGAFGPFIVQRWVMPVTDLHTTRSIRDRQEPKYRRKPV